eukprot:4053406-Pleurochrysis_carterae.AAC.2
MSSPGLVIELVPSSDTAGAAIATCETISASCDSARCRVGAAATPLEAAGAELAVRLRLLDTTGAVLSSGIASGSLRYLSISESPLLSAVFPAAGSIMGRQQVCLHGSNLNRTSTPSISFGSECAVTHASARRVCCITAAHEKAAVDVLVSLPGLGAAVAVAPPISYNFIESPVISSIEPKIGYSGGLVHLHGVGFVLLPDSELESGSGYEGSGDGSGEVFDEMQQGNSTVLFDETPCDIVEMNDTLIVCRAGERKPGFAAVSLLTPHAGLAAGTHFFTYQITVLQARRLAPTRSSHIRSLDAPEFRCLAHAFAH